MQLLNYNIRLIHKQENEKRKSFHKKEIKKIVIHLFINYHYNWKLIKKTIKYQFRVNIDKPEIAAILRLYVKQNPRLDLKYEYRAAMD